MIRIISFERFFPRRLLFTIYEAVEGVVLLLLILAFLVLFVMIYFKRKKLLQAYPVKTVFCCVLTIDSVVIYFLSIGMDFLADLGIFLFFTL
jgi:hypothetical protein